VEPPPGEVAAGRQQRLHRRRGRHAAIQVGQRIHDAFAGPAGLTLEEYMTRLINGRMDIVEPAGSTLQSLVAWAHGCAASRRHNRRPDRFPELIVWLRDVKRDMPPGRVRLYLRRHVGDHHAAIHHFLSHVAELAAQSAPGH